MRRFMRWLGFGNTHSAHAHEEDALAHRLRAATKRQEMATRLVEQNSNKQIRRASDAQVVVESALRKLGPGAIVVSSAEEAMAIIEGRHNASRR